MGLPGASRLPRHSFAFRPSFHAIGRELNTFLHYFKLFQCAIHRVPELNKLLLAQLKGGLTRLIAVIIRDHLENDYRRHPNNFSIAITIGSGTWRIGMFLKNRP